MKNQCILFHTARGKPAWRIDSRSVSCHVLVALHLGKGHSTCGVGPVVRRMGSTIHKANAPCHVVGNTAHSFREVGHFRFEESEDVTIAWTSRPHDSTKPLRNTNV